MLAVPVARRMPAFRHGLARALLAIWLLAGASDALSAQDVHRVLVVYENESTQATAVAIGRGLHERLNAQGPTKFEIYSEYLDNARFPEPENQERLAAHFAAKYAHRNIDVAIALGPNALKFLLDRRDQILRGAPLVFGAVSKDILTSTSFPENATGVVSQYDTAKTIELARRLQPDAERIVIISGSGAFVGRDLASLVSQVIASKDPLPQPLVSTLDWRQIQRWGIAEDRIPDDAEIRFRTPSAWDQFRNEILLVIAVMALQAAMIAAQGRLARGLAADLRGDRRRTGRQGEAPERRRAERAQLSQLYRRLQFARLSGRQDGPITTP